MSVCLFAIRFHAVQPILMKLSRNYLLIQGEFDVYLFRKTNELYRCYRQSKKLTNEIAAFRKMEIFGSEGGRKPSERSDTTLHMFYLSQLGACYMLLIPLTNGIAAFFIITKSVKEHMLNTKRRIERGFRGC